MRIKTTRLEGENKDLRKKLYNLQKLNSSIKEDLKKKNALLDSIGENLELEERVIQGVIEGLHSKLCKIEYLLSLSMKSRSLGVFEWIAFIVIPLLSIGLAWVSFFR